MEDEAAYATGPIELPNLHRYASDNPKLPPITVIMSPPYSPTELGRIAEMLGLWTYSKSKGLEKGACDSDIMSTTVRPKKLEGGLEQSSCELDMTVAREVLTFPNLQSGAKSETNSNPVRVHRVPPITGP